VEVTITCAVVTTACVEVTITCAVVTIACVGVTKACVEVTIADAAMMTVYLGARTAQSEVWMQRPIGTPPERSSLYASSSGKGGSRGSSCVKSVASSVVIIFQMMSC
jgi:hypothetical protein